MSNLFWATLLLAALLLAVWERYRLQRTLHHLDHMLDDAIQGRFQEQDFNESLLSALETKLAHYLSASAVSTQNLQEEKNKIKTLIADISHQTKTPISCSILSFWKNRPMNPVPPRCPRRRGNFNP